MYLHSTLIKYKDINIRLSDISLYLYLHSTLIKYKEKII